MNPILIYQNSLKYFSLDLDPLLELPQAMLSLSTVPPQPETTTSSPSLVSSSARPIKSNYFPAAEVKEIIRRRPVSKHHPQVSEE